MLLHERPRLPVGGVDARPCFMSAGSRLRARPGSGRSCPPARGRSPSPAWTKSCLSSREAEADGVGQLGDVLLGRRSGSASSPAGSSSPCRVEQVALGRRRPARASRVDVEADRDQVVVHRPAPGRARRPCGPPRAAGGCRCSGSGSRRGSGSSAASIRSPSATGLPVLVGEVEVERDRLAQLAPRCRRAGRPRTPVAPRRPAPEAGPSSQRGEERERDPPAGRRHGDRRGVVGWGMGDSSAGALEVEVARLARTAGRRPARARCRPRKRAT